MTASNIRDKIFKNTSLFYAFIGVGVILAIYQYIFNRSLWLDESSLARNIISKGFLELLQPLDHNQVAPIGYLWVARFFVVLFGDSELPMRLVSLISFLACIPVLYKLGTKITSDRLVGLTATALFTLNPTAIYFASEVKQYMTDALAILLILYSTVSTDFESKKSVHRFGFIGATIILFSNVAIIGLFVSGLYFFYFQIIRKKNLYPLVAATMWLISFGLYYSFFIHNHPTEDYMVNYWDFAFLPMKPWNKDFWQFLHQVVYLLYKNLLDVRGLGLLAIVLTAITFISGIARRNLRIIFLLIAPIGVHLVLSGLKLYPYFTRLILYQLPLIILLISIGAVVLFRWVNKRFMLPYALLLIPVIITATNVYNNFPQQKHEIKNSLTYMQQHIQKNDLIFVYYIAYNPYLYYQQIGFIYVDNPVQRSQNYRKDSQKYIDLLDKLEGRVWMVMTHTFKKSKTVTINYIENKRGGKLLDEQHFYGSDVYLFDIPASDKSKQTTKRN